MYKLDIWGQDYEIDTSMIISGDKFSAFLKKCFDNADLFSFNEAIWTNCSCKDMQKELEPFLTKEIQVQKWFGYDYAMAPEMDRRTIRVYLYQADSAAKDSILQYCSDVFLRQNIGGEFMDPVQTLEDLCFFSDGKLFVGTVSHEFLLKVEPPSKDFEDSMKKLGRWKYTNQLPPIGADNSTLYFCKLDI